MSRRRGRRRGQALAEFALVLPLFLLVSLVLVDFARGIFIYSVISDAAREGARYAMVHGSLATTDNPPAIGPGTGDPNGTINIVPKTRELAFGLDQSALNAGACWGFGCSIPTNCGTGTNTAVGAVPDVEVTVRTCYDFQPITASFLRLGTLQLSAQATLTITH